MIYPFHFFNPTKYYIKFCSSCHKLYYTFEYCPCQEVYYCCVKCKNNHFVSHLINCNIGLREYILKDNIRLKKIYSEKKDKIKQPVIIGLKNLGKNCYMNSCLQSLLSIKELRDYLLNDFEIEKISKNKIIGLFLLGFYHFILDIYTSDNNNNYYCASIFDIILTQLSELKDEDYKEDELLYYLFKKINNDLMSATTFEINSNSINSSTANGEKYWNNFIKYNKSKFVDLFYGQLRSIKSCPNCDFKLVFYTTFWILTLPIIDKKENEKVLLTECIKNFQTIEKKGSDKNQIYCKKCSKNVNPLIKKDFDHMPKILVIVLKRFYRNYSKRTFVEFPLNNLEINIRKNKAKYYYNLISVINHIGSKFYGHYTSICKYDSKWYNFDDHIVKEIDCQNINSAFAYILFYKLK